MAKLFVQAQATSNRSEYVFVQDSASTTGGGKTGIAFNAASFTAYYVRPLGSATAITLATQTVTGAWSSGGWVEVDATNLPGIYRFDIPNAVFATGVDHAVVMLKGASGMAPVSLEYQLVGFDPATSWLTSAQTAAAVWDEARASHVTAGTFGEYVNAELVTPVTAGTSVHIGPYQLLADGLGADQPLDVNVGTASTVDVQVTDANGTGIDITGATATAKVYSSAGTLVASYAGTATYADNGRLSFGLTTTVTNTSGTYTVLVTRTTGATDTQIFGPLRLYVRPV